MTLLHLVPGCIVTIISSHLTWNNFVRLRNAVQLVYASAEKKTLTLSLSANGNPNYPPLSAKKLKKNEVVHINMTVV